MLLFVTEQFMNAAFKGVVNISAALEAVGNE